MHDIPNLYNILCLNTQDERKYNKFPLLHLPIVDRIGFLFDIDIKSSSYIFFLETSFYFSLTFNFLFFADELIYLLESMHSLITSFHK